MSDEPPEMHHHVERPCDEIDAAVFSGDILHSAEALARFEWYLARWQREIVNIKRLLAEG